MKKIFILLAGLFFGINLFAQAPSNNTSTKSSEPIVWIYGSKDKDNVSKSQLMSKGRLWASGKIKGELWLVDSYEITLMNYKTGVHTFYVKGASFASSDIMELISNLRTGQKIFFSNINVRNTAGEVYPVSDVVYTIK